jgi:multimeric flavodoxin WrbA
MKLSVKSAVSNDNRSQADAERKIMKKIVAIVGSYRKTGMVHAAVDEILAGAKDAGAETVKIDLLDQPIGFCKNCRSCTQQPGEKRGACVQHDGMEFVLSEIESADALVLASPVNFYSVTAVFHRFMERLLVYAYWPWNGRQPLMRLKKTGKKAALVSAAGMPGFLIPLMTSASRALKLTAGALGAAPGERLWIGMAAQSQNPVPSEKLRMKARRIGIRLARNA